MENKVKFAIVGCGRIAPNHLDGIKNAPSAELVAVCDIEESACKRASEENGNVPYYTDMEEMLEKESIDVCCILTPSGYHASCGIIAARHKVHVFCEKPLDVSVANMKKLINECKKNNVLLGCVFQRRTMNMAMETKKAVENGYLGRVTMASAYLKYYRDQEYYNSGDWRGTWEIDGGGALMNQGVHGVDLIRFMMGDVKSVISNCKNLVWDTEVEDTAVAILNFENGGIGVVEGATSAYPGNDTVFALHGSEGTIAFGDGKIYEWNLKNKDIERPEKVGSLGGPNCSYCTDNIGHTLLIEDMARAVLENRPPMITGEDALESVKIVLAIYKSSEEKREVFLDEF